MGLSEMQLILLLCAVYLVLGTLVESLAAARERARPFERVHIVANDTPFPEATLSFHANVLNGKALAFYRRHGVRDIEPAAESGLPLGGRVVMTTKYCLKDELGLCRRRPRAKDAFAPAEPWFLVDDEGRRLRLRFHCDQRDCVMEIVYEG